MSATTPTQPPLSPPISEAVDASENLYRMSVDEYERIGELLDDSRVELIDGLLVAKMVKNPPHQVAYVLAYEALAPVTPSGWHLRLGSRVDFRDGQNVPVVIEGVEVGRIAVAEVLP